MTEVRRPSFVPKGLRRAGRRQKTEDAEGIGPEGSGCRFVRHIPILRDRPAKRRGLAEGGQKGERNMKTRLFILGCLVGVVILLSRWGAAQGSKAESNSLEIGVVNVRRVFRDCKRGARYSAEVFTEQQRVKAELEKIGKEVEAGEAGLKALKSGDTVSKLMCFPQNWSILVFV